jgi:hypothetical protein
MNKYNIVAIGLLLVFIILLFSGFTYTSIYHWLISFWIFMCSSLLAMKAHFIKNPHLASKGKYIYAFTISISIILSLVMPVLVNNPPRNSIFITKMIITVFNSFLILFGIAKLFLQWRKLTTTFIVTSFIAIFVLLSSILFFWIFI